MIILKLVLRVFCIWLVAASTHAQVQTSGKHVYFLQGGELQLFGSYLSGANNPSDQKALGNIPLFLPKGISEFQPAQGMSKESIKISENGLSVEQEFEPGMNLLAIDFIMDTDSSSKEIDVVARDDVKELAILLNKDSPLEIVGLDKDADLVTFGQRQYRGYRMKGLRKGERKTFKVTGLSVGRQHLWRVGYGFAILLGTLSIGFAMRTKPKEDQLTV